MGLNLIMIEGKKNGCKKDSITPGNSYWCGSNKKNRNYL
jgi:hypothetical protein